MMQNFTQQLLRRFNHLRQHFRHLVRRHDFNSLTAHFLVYLDLNRSGSEHLGAPLVCTAAFHKTELEQGNLLLFVNIFAFENLSGKTINQIVKRAGYIVRVKLRPEHCTDLPGIVFQAPAPKPQIFKICPNNNDEAMKYYGNHW